MAVSKALQQIQWGAANSVSVTAGAAQTSDAITFGAASFVGAIQLKADNSSGSPASVDKVDFYALFTLGDPDANPDSADEYDTTTQGTWLATLDTTISDPCLTTVQLNVIAKGMKLYAKNNATANAITVSAQIYEGSA